MRGIGELEPAVARAIEAVAFDVDDTVTREGVVEREAMDALFALRDAGIPRIAVTGRPLGWADVIAATWPVSAAVGENGAGWAWRVGRELREGYWESDEARVRGERSLAAVRAVVARDLPELTLAWDQRGRRCDLAFDVGERARCDAATIARLRSVLEREGMRVVVSSVHAHAMRSDWDKAQGTVRAMREVLGWDEARVRERVLFVGDSGNDAAAFAFFARTAGVANVRDHLASLPRAPGYVSSADRGRGFAEIVGALLAARGSEAR